MSDGLTTIEISDLTADEGFKVRVYDDATGLPIGPGSFVKGNPTIGIGRNVGSRGPGLSGSEIASLLADDLAKLNAQVGALDWWVAMSTPRKAVIVEMAFNLGEAGMLSFVGMIACLRKGDYSGAAMHMLASKWAGQLPDRVAILAQVMTTGIAR